MKTALLEEIEKLATEGLSEVELARAKKKLIGQQQIANQSNDSLGYMTALDELYGLGFDHLQEAGTRDRSGHAGGRETRGGQIFPAATLRYRDGETRKSDGPAKKE